MWKILVAFIIFAAISLTLVITMGDKVDMQGEAGGHNTTETQGPAPAKPAEAAADAASAPATPAASDATKK